MRIPLNWLGEFVKLPKSQKDLTDKLTMAGHMLDKTDEVNGNTVIDLELRGNRADCYSIMGIAREVSALTGVKIKTKKTETKLKKTKKLNNINLDIKTDLVKRVMMVEIKNVKVEKSPKWITERLQEYGIASINNIVDLTNYVMIETGQPMHAFDADLIGKNLEIRMAKNKEQMVTFLGQSITLDKNDLVWANENNVLSVAGAIGGKEHSINSETKNILLEAANYDRANIRRSIHKHKLLTEAGIRHEKELDPNLVEIGIVRFLELLQRNSVVYDYYPKPRKILKLILDFDYLNKLSGFNIDTKDVVKILKSLNFEIVKQTKETLEVSVPTYRTDVTLEEDLVEEVLRIYGYDRIPAQTLSLEIPKVVTPSFINQEIEIKNIMVGLGFSEVISLSFVSENYLKLNKAIEGKNYEPVKILNRPSPDNEFLRMTLFPNLYENTKKILNERGDESYLFEVGKIYLKDKSEYIEKRKLGVAYYQKGQEFVYFKGYIESLFEKLNIDNSRFEESGSGFLIKIEKYIIAYGFNFENIYYCEIDLDIILEKNHGAKVNLWPKYPPQIEDVTIQITDSVAVANIIETIKKEKQITEVEIKDIYKNSYTFRIWYQDKNKTLTDKEVEKIRNKYLKEIKDKFGGVVKN